MRYNWNNRKGVVKGYGEGVGERFDEREEVEVKIIEKRSKGLY